MQQRSVGIECQRGANEGCVDGGFMRTRNADAREKAVLIPNFSFFIFLFSFFQTTGTAF